MDRTELIATVARDILVAAIEDRRMPSQLAQGATPMQKAEELGEAYKALFSKVAEMVNKELNRG